MKNTKAIVLAGAVALAVASLAACHKQGNKNNAAQPAAQQPANATQPAANTGASQ